MPSRNYVLTPGAVDDLREIADWSLQRWDKQRTLKYLTDLHDGIEYIAAHFESFRHNKAREALSGDTGLLLHPVNKHYVAYVPISEKSIAVAAIIRQRRDIPSILQKDGFTIYRELHEINTLIAQGMIAPPQSSE